MTKDQIPADDILRIVTVPAGATIVAVHDRATRSLDLICTLCGNPYTLLLSRGCTNDAVDKRRAAFAEQADRHAAIRHTPRVDTAGSQP